MRIVTVSTDTPAEIRLGHKLHGLEAIMLADPTLVVTDLFGLRNRNFNNFKFPNRPGLPVPTSLLVDGRGKVVWMDQSEHFNQRSAPEVVRAALRLLQD